MDGIWECPDLFPLAVEGLAEQNKWVLKVDALKGTGAQYFIGDFDGTRFINDATDDQILRVDYGNDFYAAQSWSDEPNDRRIWIGWLNNWHYANLIPTSPGADYSPFHAKLHLRQYPEGLRLIQKPIEELKGLRQSIFHTTDTDIDTINSQLTKLAMDNSLEIYTEFTVDTAREFGVRFCTGDAEATVIGYDTQVQEIFLDRRHSGDITFSDKFDDVQRAPLVPEQCKINLHIFVDACSVEIFANNGLIVISDLIFPGTQNIEIEIYSRDGDVYLNKVDVWKLVVEN